MEASGVLEQEAPTAPNPIPCDRSGMAGCRDGSNAGVVVLAVRQGLCPAYRPRTLALSVAESFAPSFSQAGPVG